MKTRKQIPTVLVTAALLAQLALPAADAPVLKPNGKPADMTKKVKVFILLGQSNMVGMGKIKGGEGSLEHALKEKKKYPYLVDEAGNWVERQDVRFVRVMQGRGGGGMQQFNNEWITVAKCKTIGPEFGLAHLVGDAMDAPVMILKSCIGNRSLSWDLLPPGSERFEFVIKDRAGVEKKMVYAGYKDKPESWEMDSAKGLKTEPAPWVDKSGKPIDWYAGKQYDDDISYAKKVLSELDKYYPGAQGCEVAGFFFWQGDKDRYNPVHAANYEKNLVQLIKALRKDFDAPNAKFVVATLGQTKKDDASNANEKMILDAQLAVGDPTKHPEFKGTVASVYSNPFCHGGASNSHYGGNAETYMDIGEAMGRAMAELIVTSGGSSK